MMISKLINVVALSTLATVGGLASVATAQFPISIFRQFPQSPTQRMYQEAALPQSMEQDVFNQINQYRASHRLPPLKMDSRISAQALAHSQAMANGKVSFSHNGFQQRVQVISRSISYAGAAENVSYSMGYKDPATQAVQGWLKSTGHRKNIEGNYNLTGIGIAQNSKGEVYFTQIFIKTRG